MKTDYLKIVDKDIYIVNLYETDKHVPLRYEDDFIAVYGYGKISVKDNENLSLCDNLDYKNDVDSLFMRIGGRNLYKLEGEHLDQIRGKLIQIPRMFQLDKTKKLLLADYCLLEEENLICLWTCSPLFVWFKNCKFTNI